VIRSPPGLLRPPSLELDYIPLEYSVVDMGKALIATGYIPPAATAAAS